jgi:hypothetical protein
MPTATKAPAKKTVVKKAAAKETATPKSPAKKKAAKKAAPKGNRSKENKTISIKYSDKSAGQPELVVIFDNIKKMMEPYHKKRSLILHAEKPSQANLVSHKPVTIEGRERNELWFVSALVQKGYVGFYCQPQDEMKEHFSKAFVKSLKGKSCFHIRENTPEIMGDIKKAIKLGYEAYLEKGLL